MRNCATLFSTLLQNELKSDAARCSTHVQTCLVTNQVVELREYRLVIGQNCVEVTPYTCGKTSLLKPGKTRDMYRLILFQTAEVLLRANAPNVRVSMYGSS